MNRPLITYEAQPIKVAILAVLVLRSSFPQCQPRAMLQYNQSVKTSQLPCLQLQFRTHTFQRMPITLLHFVFLFVFAFISVSLSDVPSDRCDSKSNQRCQAALSKMSEAIVLSEEQKLAFVNDGYIILRGVIPEELLSAANTFIDDAQAAGKLKDDTRKILGEDIPTHRFQKETAEAREVTNLLFKAGLYETAEDLLGEDYAVVTGNMGHLDVVPTCKLFVERGMKINRPHPKKRWKVIAGTGKHAKKGAGYSLLVSVALSEGQDVDENRGQIVVWPGALIYSRVFLQVCWKAVITCTNFPLVFCVHRLPLRHTEGNCEDCPKCK